MLKSKNGFTLIEILIVIGLSAIIISLVMSFFMINIKNYEAISIETELQFQSQYILNYMSNKILQSSYIELIRENTVSHMNHIGKQRITKISFRYGDSSKECYNFEVRNDKIFYGNDYSTSTANIELGTYINELYVEPFPETAIFKNVKAIKIKLILQRHSKFLEAEQVVFMRN